MDPTKPWKSGPGYTQVSEHHTLVGNPHPYRSPEPAKPTTMEIKTDDVSVKIAYLDRTGSMTLNYIEFLGKPSAWIHSYDNEAKWSPGWGTSAFLIWKKETGSNQFAVINDLIIPMHRVLDMQVTIKTRTVVVDIENR